MEHEWAAQRGVVHQSELCTSSGFSGLGAGASACGYSTLEVSLFHSNRLREKMEDSNMPRTKQSSKRIKAALPALGAAGLTFSMVGGASAAVAPANDASQATNYSPNQQVTLGEEEIADVSLATFYVFDKENTAASKEGTIQLARGCGCRGCGGCRGCRGCGRGCGCGGG